MRKWHYYAQVWRQVFYAEDELVTQEQIVEKYGERVFVDPFGCMHIARVSNTSGIQEVQHAECDDSLTPIIGSSTREDTCLVGILILSNLSEEAVRLFRGRQRVIGSCADGSSLQEAGNSSSAEVSLSLVLLQLTCSRRSGDRRTQMRTKPRLG